MDISGNWQGYFIGTNRGIVWFTIQHQDSKAAGSGNLNDFDFGATTFELDAEIKAKALKGRLFNLKGGQSQLPKEISIDCEILNEGTGLAGNWSSDSGTSGKIVVSRPGGTASGLPQALISRPVVLKAYSLDGASFAGLLEVCLRGMVSRPIFRIIEGDVTHIKTGVEELIQSWRTWPEHTINEITVSVSDNLGSLGAKEILLELKRNDLNRLTVTSGDSVWVDGKIEQIKKYLDRHRAGLNHIYRKYGTSLNSLIFLGMMIWLPSLPFISRLIFVVGTVAILFLLLFFYNRLLPNTRIFVREQKPSFLQRNKDAILVSVVTLVAGGVLAYLGRLLLRWFGQQDAA